MKKLSVLLINNYFPPEIGAASHQYYYLGKELVKRGHNVVVLTGIPRYNVPKEVYQRYLVENLRKSKVVLDELNGMKVIRVRLPYVQRDQMIRRGLEHFEIAFKLYNYAKKILRNLSLDISLVYSPPLTLYWTAKQIREMIDVPFVLNVQDIFPQEAIDLGVLKNPILIGFFRKMERIAYKSADAITVHSERNRHFVQSAMIKQERDKVFVIENMVDPNEVKPANRENTFSLKHRLSEKFVVSYAGTLGVFQDINIVLEAAKELKNFRDIVFLIVGNGIKFDEARKLASEWNLTNILFLPLVPREEYPLVLHSSDVSLATLTKELKTPPVPSKILSIMSAGIPVIGAMNLDGDAPRLIERAKAGYAIPAGDYKALAERILLLYKNPDLRKEMGANGRKYVEEHLSASKIAEEYEKLFVKLIEARK